MPRDRFHALVLLTALSTLLAACGESDDTPSEKRGPMSQGGPQQGARGPGGMPAPLVVTAAVKSAPFASELEALGTAKANEAVDIVAKVSNRVTAIRFREGQFVRAGEVLLELDADESQADLAVAEAALGDSRSQVNRSRELAATKALSAQQMEQLEASLHANEARVASARARLNEQIIRAPFAGRVGLRNVSIGSLVSPGTVITTLDDLAVMKLDFSVPETYLQQLTEGLEIKAQTAAYPEQSFSGRVLTVGSRIDPVSRSITVRAQVPNRDSKLKPGMFMTVRLTSAKTQALVIPEQALVPERDKQFVFAVRDGKAAKTEIVVGRRRPGEVEVLHGLESGDLVISEGTQKVRDGQPVRFGGGE
jgi:membrane fusion protein (multidrug efflux system)